jgi:anti-sigma regulatory factor (Ser/Thr protein kinase)
VTTSQLTFPAEVSSVPAARRFARDSLIALGAAGACDDAEMLVCERATNAVLHARTSFTVTGQLAGQPPVPSADSAEAQWF